MKNIFGMNVKTMTENSINIDGKPFIVKTVDGELTRKQDALEKEGKAFEKTAAPWWLKALYYLGIYGGLLCLVIFLRLALEKDFKDFPASVYWFLGIGLLLVAVWGVAFYSLKKRTKSVQNSSSFQYREERVEKVLEETHAELGIPSDAKLCDVFGCAYKVKSNGKTKPVNLMAEYVTLEVSVFREEEALCLADAQMKLKIPFENIRRFYRVNKRAMSSGWNKPTRFNKGEYKQYKIRTNQYGTLFIKPYYVLEIYYQSEDYQLKFPCYEYETFRALLGRDAEI